MLAAALAGRADAHHMIEIVDYNGHWPELFAQEAGEIRRLLDDVAIRIEHVGSTAVPGLAAKPVIDIQVSVQSLDDRTYFNTQLGALGYGHIDLGDFDRVYPFYAKPPLWPTTHHVHLCGVGSPEERTHLAFRDFLRDHADVAAEYAVLKRQLATKHVGDSIRSIERYSIDKTDFVRRILDRALAQGYPREAP